MPPGYDPSQFPAFAVTVDVVILTMSEGALHVLLVRRGEAPFEGMWAIPGGFKRPTETLDEAARRELAEETGVDAASLLTQFGAYGDPGRDPRMNVVTVAYLAVLRDVGAVVGGHGRSATPPWSRCPTCSNGKIELAFDHLRIVRDAIERVRVELEVTGIATAFVGATFTLAELRAVYEAVWGVQLDAANFRRSVVAEDGWVIPTGRRARPGSAGGRPAELYRAGRAWRHGGPIHRAANRREEVNAMRAVVHDRYGPPEVLRLEEVERPVPKDDEVLVRIHATTVTRYATAGCAAPSRSSPASSPASAGRSGGSPAWSWPGRSRRSARPSPSSQVGDEVFGVSGVGANAEYVCVRESGALAHKPAGMTLRGGGGGLRRGDASRWRACRRRIFAKGRSILVYGASGSIGTAAVQLAKALRRRRHGGVQHEERRARALARSRRGRSTTRRRTSRRTARRTTSSSTRSASTRSGAAGAR